MIGAADIQIRYILTAIDRATGAATAADKRIRASAVETQRELSRTAAVSGRSAAASGRAATMASRSYAGVGRAATQAGIAQGRYAAESRGAASAGSAAGRGAQVAARGAAASAVATERAAVAQASFATRMRGAAAGMAVHGRTMQRTGQQVDRFGSRLRSLALPALAIGAAAIKMSVDFDDSLNKMVRLVGISHAQVNAWRGDILKLSGATAKSPKELADAMFFITSAGLRGSRAMDALTASAKASSAGLGDTKTVADAATSAMNAYAKSHLTAKGATDVLVATVTAGKMPADQLAASLGRIIPISSALGVRFHEVGASMASMTRIGFSSAQAATALRGILGGILRPSKGAEQAFNSLGTSSARLRQELKDKGLLATFQDIAHRAHGNTAELSKMIPNVRALSGFLAAMGDNSKSTSQIFNQLAHSSGATNRAFEEAHKTAKHKLEAALNDMRVALIKLGDTLGPVLLPLLSHFAQFIGKVATAFDHLPGPLKSSVAALVILAATLGPMLSLGGKLIGTYAGVARAIGGLVAPTQAAAAAQTELDAAQAGGGGGVLMGGKRVTGTATTAGRAVRGATIAEEAAVPAAATAAPSLIARAAPIVGKAGPIGAAVAASALNVADTVKDFKKSPTRGAASAAVRFNPATAIPAMMFTVIDHLLGTHIMKSVVDAVTKAFRAIGRLAGTVARFFMPILASIGRVLAGAGRVIAVPFRAAFNVLKAVVNAGIKILATPFRIFFNIVKGIVTVGMKIVGTAFKVYLGVIGLLIKAQVFIWGTIFRTAFTVIKAIVTTGFNIIKALVVPWFNVMKSVITAGWNVIKAVFQTALAVIRAVVTTYINAIKAVWTTIINILKGPAQLAWKAVTSVFNAAVGIVTGAVHTVMNAIKGVWNGITSVFSGPAGRIGKVVSDIFNGAVGLVKGAAGHIVDGIKSVFTGIGGTIGGVMKDAINGVIDIINTGIDTINHDVIDNIPDVLGSRPGHIGKMGHLKAVGGRVPGARTADDSVPAWLSPQEFVVTEHGEGILEDLTGIPGVLDMVEGMQRPHFATGGRVAEAVGSAAARYAKGGWVRTGATVDPTSGQSGSFSAHGGRSFAELLQAGTNRGLHPTLTELLGLHGGTYGMPMETKIWARMPGRPETAHQMWKNDVGSGQPGNRHYTTDLHTHMGNLIGWHPNQDIEVSSGVGIHATSTKRGNPRKAPKAAGAAAATTTTYEVPGGTEAYTQGFGVGKELGHLRSLIQVQTETSGGGSVSAGNIHPKAGKGTPGTRGGGKDPQNMRNWNVSGAGSLTRGQVRALRGVVNIGWSGGPLAKWVAYMYKFARAHGWDGAPGQESLSGFRTPHEQAISGSVIKSGSHHEYDRYPGGAIDIGSDSSRARFNQIIAHSKYQGLIYNSGAAHGDHVHSSSGRGGLPGMAGSWRAGGRVPRFQTGGRRRRLPHIGHPTEHQRRPHGRPLAPPGKKAPIDPFNPNLLTTDSALYTFADSLDKVSGKGASALGQLDRIEARYEVLVPKAKQPMKNRLTNALNLIHAAIGAALGATIAAVTTVQRMVDRAQNALTRSMRRRGVDPTSTQGLNEQISQMESVVLPAELGVQAGLATGLARAHGALPTAPGVTPPPRVPVTHPHHPKPKHHAKKVPGLNPWNNHIEHHTAAEWRMIRLKYQQYRRAHPVHHGGHHAHHRRRRGHFAGGRIGAAQFFRRGGRPAPHRAAKKVKAPVHHPSSVPGDIAAEIQTALEDMSDTVDETMTQIIELKRQAVEQAAQDAVDHAAHVTTLAQTGLQTLELQQQLAGTFDTGGQQRSDYIKNTILPALQGDLRALQQQQQAAASQGDQKLADQIGEAVASKQNDLLQAQLDATQAVADNTASLKEFGGSLVTEFNSTAFGDIAGIKAGA